MLKDSTRELFLANESATVALGERFGKLAQGNLVIALSGPLGSGKTVFVKGLARALCIDQPVTSPTFIFMNEYHDGRLPLYHLDLYRMQTLDGNSQLESDLLDTRAYLNAELNELAIGESVVVIEWPEFLDLPTDVGSSAKESDNFLKTRDHLAITLSYVREDDLARTACIRANGVFSEELIKEVLVDNF
jgi:tRNA threonylcarbamoyladenosine biosynthesis protein TsaE